MATIRQGAAAELYQALVREGCERSGQVFEEMRESYLVFVLLRHQRDAHLLARTQALEWLHAQEQLGSARTEALRDIGDRCLLIAGLYPALAERRRVDADYFIELGRGAYQGVAESSRTAYAVLFEQLAVSYRDLVRALRAIRGDHPAPLPPLRMTA